MGPTCECSCGGACCAAGTDTQYNGGCATFFGGDCGVGPIFSLLVLFFATIMIGAGVSKCRNYSKRLKGEGGAPGRRASARGRVRVMVKLFQGFCLLATQLAPTSLTSPIQHSPYSASSLHPQPSPSTAVCHQPSSSAVMSSVLSTFRELFTSVLQLGCVKLCGCGVAAIAIVGLVQFFTEGIKIRHIPSSLALPFVGHLYLPQAPAVMRFLAIMR